MQLRNACWSPPSTPTAVPSEEQDRTTIPGVAQEATSLLMNWSEAYPSVRLTVAPSSGASSTTCSDGSTLLSLRNVADRLEHFCYSNSSDGIDAALEAVAAGALQILSEPAPEPAPTIAPAGTELALLTGFVRKAVVKQEGMVSEQPHPQRVELLLRILDSALALAAAAKAAYTDLMEAILSGIATTLHGPSQTPPTAESPAVASPAEQLLKRLEGPTSVALLSIRDAIQQYWMPHVMTLREWPAAPIVRRYFVCLHLLLIDQLPTATSRAQNATTYVMTLSNYMTEKEQDATVHADYARVLAHLLLRRAMGSEAEATLAVEACVDVFRYIFQRLAQSSTTTPIVLSTEAVTLIKALTCLAVQMLRVRSRPNDATTPTTTTQDTSVLEIALARLLQWLGEDDDNTAHGQLLRSVASMVQKYPSLAGLWDPSHVVGVLASIISRTREQVAREGIDASNIAIQSAEFARRKPVLECVASLLSMQHFFTALVPTVLKPHVSSSTTGDDDVDSSAFADAAASLRMLWLCLDVVAATAQQQQQQSNGSSSYRPWEDATTVPSIAEAIQVPFWGYQVDEQRSFAKSPDPADSDGAVVGAAEYKRDRGLLEQFCDTVLIAARVALRALDSHEHERSEAPQSPPVQENQQQQKQQTTRAPSSPSSWVIRFATNLAAWCSVPGLATASQLRQLQSIYSDFEKRFVEQRGTTIVGLALSILHETNHIVSRHLAGDDESTTSSRAQASARAAAHVMEWVVRRVLPTFLRPSKEEVVATTTTGAEHVIQACFRLGCDILQLSFAVKVKLVVVKVLAAVHQQLLVGNTTKTKTMSLPLTLQSASALVRTLSLQLGFRDYKLLVNLVPLLASLCETLATTVTQKRTTATVAVDADTDDDVYFDMLEVQKAVLYELNFHDSPRMLQVYTQHMSTFVRSWRGADIAWSLDKLLDRLLTILDFREAKLQCATLEVLLLLCRTSWVRLTHNHSVPLLAALVYTYVDCLPLSDTTGSSSSSGGGDASVVASKILDVAAALRAQSIISDTDVANVLPDPPQQLEQDELAPLRLALSLAGQRSTSESTCRFHTVPLRAAEVNREVSSAALDTQPRANSADRVGLKPLSMQELGSIVGSGGNIASSSSTSAGKTARRPAKPLIQVIPS